jgi:hypothetical protein
MALNIPPARTPVVDSNGLMNPAWYRYFVSLNTTADEAQAGEVATPAAGGLQGGGAVADGVTLSIADNGVTRGMLDEGMACSVIGRHQGSAGDVADITADANNRVLTREADMLAFRNFINGVSIGTTTAAPLVRAASFESTATPAASGVTTDCTIPIVTASGTKFIMLSDTAT